MNPTRKTHGPDSPLFKLANQLYKYCYPIYRPMYFYYKSISEKDHIETIKTHVKEGMTILDIGANIGFYSELLSDLVGPQGRVHSFEPDKKNFERLQQRVGHRKNIKLHQKAVGEKNDTLKLYYSEALNVDHRTYDPGGDRLSYEVESICLDDFLASESIDFIKIDVQGFDYFALKGCGELIRRSPNITIMGEYWPYGLSKSGLKDSWQYIELLESYGLKVELSNVKREQVKELESQDDFYTEYIASKA